MLPPQRRKSVHRSPRARSPPVARPKRNRHAIPMSEPAETPNPEGGFVSHLIELRIRLVIAFGAVGAVFIVLMIVPGSNQVYALIAQPLMDVLPAGMSMIATEVASPFLTPLKFTLAAAVTLTIPFLLYQLWAFVPIYGCVPGGTEHDCPRGRLAVPHAAQVHAGRGRHVDHSVSALPALGIRCARSLQTRETHGDAAGGVECVAVLRRYGVCLLCRVSVGIRAVRGHPAAGRADDDRHQVLSRLCVFHVLCLRPGLRGAGGGGDPVVHRSGQPGHPRRKAA